MGVQVPPFAPRSGSAKTENDNRSKKKTEREPTTERTSALFISGLLEARSPSVVAAGFQAFLQPGELFTIASGGRNFALDLELRT
ncbi:MAG TPA: hypothetical protein PKA58_32440 [Polyangium sp.]|nr:hypothetical protein [Polyangium sp.]